MEPAIKINPGASKWDIRHKVWDYIEEENLANFPRPVHNRIPNFKGAFTACSRVSELHAFGQAAEVKVDPDKPLEGARLAALQAQKTLLVPTPRLHTGLFNRITPPAGASREQLRRCSSSQGVRDFSVPIGLDAKVKVDLVVVGSVAASEKGFRIGKGEGFADMEYGMMACMGAVGDSTVVVTIVHDCQIVDIPEELVESHDLTVDYILTPTQVIKTDCQRPKPQGIIWSKLDIEKLQKIPILQRLRELEEQAGKDVTLGAAPVGAERGERSTAGQKAGEDPEGASRRGKRAQKGSRGEDSTGKERGKGRRRGPREEQGPEEGVPPGVTTVYLGGIPAGLRVSELKGVLREKEATPLRLTWQGAQHRAFLDYSHPQAAEHALEALQELSVKGHSLQAQLARSQRGDKRSRQPRRRRTPETTPPPDTRSGTAEVAEQPQQEPGNTLKASQCLQDCPAGPAGFSPQHAVQSSEEN